MYALLKIVTTTLQSIFREYRDVGEGGGRGRGQNIGRKGREREGEKREYGGYPTEIRNEDSEVQQLEDCNM